MVHNLRLGSADRVMVEGVRNLGLGPAGSGMVGVVHNLRLGSADRVMVEGVRNLGLGPAGSGMVGWFTISDWGPQPQLPPIKTRIRLSLHK